MTSVSPWDQSSRISFKETMQKCKLQKTIYFAKESYIIEGKKKKEKEDGLM